MLGFFFRKANFIFMDPSTSLMLRNRGNFRLDTGFPKEEKEIKVRGKLEELSAWSTPIGKVRISFERIKSRIPILNIFFDA